MMRTTVNLPDDVGDLVRAVADAKDISLGDAIADLVRRGLASEAQIRQDTLFPCFDISPDTSPITLEQTLAAEDEL